MSTGDPFCPSHGQTPCRCRELHLNKFADAFEPYQAPLTRFGRRMGDQPDPGAAGEAAKDGPVREDAVEFAIVMAPKLRRAGVTRFRCGDVEFDIGPEQDEPPAQTSPEAPEFREAPVRMHPLDDPETFNLPRGHALPGYRKAVKKDD